MDKCLYLSHTQHTSIPSYQRNDKLLLVIEFDDLQVLYLLSVDDKPDERAHLMEACLASSTRVNVQEVEHRVIHHLEKVRMTRDEKFWRVGEEHAPHPRVILSWIAAYMGHEDLHILTLPPQHLRESVMEIMAIYIAIDSSERSDHPETVSHLHRTNVACMPYLVAIFEILGKAIIPATVGIG